MTHTVKELLEVGFWHALCSNLGAAEGGLFDPALERADRNSQGEFEM
jgi:hypothetical protein